MPKCCKPTEHLKRDTPPPCCIHQLLTCFSGVPVAGPSYPIATRSFCESKAKQTLRHRGRAIAEAVSRGSGLGYLCWRVASSKAPRLGSSSHAMSLKLFISRVWVAGVWDVLEFAHRAGLNILKAARWAHRSLLFLAARAFGCLGRGVVWKWRSPRRQRTTLKPR